MLKAAIEKIAEMAMKPEVVTRDGHDYVIDAEGAYAELKPDIEQPDTMFLHSLSSVVQMVKREALKEFYDGKFPLFITVPKHDEVRVFTTPLAEERYYRPILYKAAATDIPGWGAETSLAFDQAAVALQTRFQSGGDLEYTLVLLSQITTGAKVTYADNGIATSIVTQKGVSLQQNQTIKPVVKLRPYRTFQEVEQPEGLFLIRINERGITFTEADGGMWKLTARKTVAEYLSEALAEEIEAGSVVVTI